MTKFIVSMFTVIFLIFVIILSPINSPNDHKMTLPILVTTFLVSNILMMWILSICRLIFRNINKITPYIVIRITSILHAIILYAIFSYNLQVYLTINLTTVGVGLFLYWLTRDLYFIINNKVNSTFAWELLAHNNPLNFFTYENDFSLREEMIVIFIYPLILILYPFYKLFMTPGKYFLSVSKWIESKFSPEINKASTTTDNNIQYEKFVPKPFSVSSYEINTPSTYQASFISEDVPLPNKYSEKDVHQYVYQSLKIAFGFRTQDMEKEFPITMGSKPKRADIVIFRSGSAHRQENILIIVECKRADKKNNANGKEQLLSYMSACINARFGVLAGANWQVWEKNLAYDGYKFQYLEHLPNAADQTINFHYDPPGQIYE